MQTCMHALSSQQDFQSRKKKVSEELLAGLFPTRSMGIPANGSLLRVPSWQKMNIPHRIRLQVGDQRLNLHWKMMSSHFLSRDRGKGAGKEAGAKGWLQNIFISAINNSLQATGQLRGRRHLLPSINLFVHLFALGWPQGRGRQSTNEKLRRLKGLKNICSYLFGGRN